LEDPLFSQIVSTRKTTIPNAVAESTRLLVNHNKMLRFYEGCIGVKTGFTKSSGRCLVSAATRDGVTLIAVTLDAPNDWNDHTQMLDHGFTQYQSITLCKAEELTRPMSVTGGTDDYVMVTNKEGAFCTLPVTHGKITTVLELPRFAFAPVLEGECVGKAAFFCDTDGDGKTEKIGEIPLVACYGVEQKAVRRSFWQWLKSLFGFGD
jgi:D-alanyl-D-alanine carboxypeptidase/D-alanyl-D-alanine carboxypeptidase (penicillin-binding protein 5/6)